MKYIIYFALATILLGCRLSNHNNALIAYKAGRYDDALYTIKYSIKKDPDNYENYLLLGTIYNGKKNYHKAIRALKHSQKLINKNSERIQKAIRFSYLMLGELHSVQASQDSAIYYYHKAFLITQELDYGF